MAIDHDSLCSHKHDHHDLLVPYWFQCLREINPPLPSSGTQTTITMTRGTWVWIEPLMQSGNPSLFVILY